MVGERTDSQKALALAQLKEGSEYLENQKEVLNRLWRMFSGKVVTFYEREACRITPAVLHDPAPFFPCVWSLKADINSRRQGRSSGKERKP